MTTTPPAASAPQAQPSMSAPLICLHCGAENTATSTQCKTCGTSLIAPDLDFNLSARLAGWTSVGRVREHNEDNLSLWAIDGVYLALVADGMGGAAAGEEASRLTVEAVQRTFLGKDKGSDKLQFLSEADLKDRVTQAIYDANRSVVNKSNNTPSMQGMGTTSTLALVRGNRLLVGHVGDSRLYVLDGRRGELHQLTADHSFVSALVASGHITADQARFHPMANVLYRALGQSIEIEIDLYEKFLKAGDRLIICSDGLVKHVDNSEILKVLLNADSPDTAAQTLIDMANENGGEDNISVIAIMIDAAMDDSDHDALETLP